MFQWIESAIWLDRATDPISVALFDQVALISEFNSLFELLGFTSYSSNPFYILEWSSKNILKMLITNFMNNFLVRNACCLYKAVEQNAKFVWVMQGV